MNRRDFVLSAGSGLLLPRSVLARHGRGAAQASSMIGNPMISRTTATPLVSSGTSSDLNSSNYNNQWQSTGGAGEYAGYNFSTAVGAGSTKFMLCWYCEHQGPEAFAYDSQDSSSIIFNAPSGYTRQKSMDGSTWVSDGPSSGVVSTTRSTQQEVFTLTGGYQYARLLFSGVNNGTVIQMKMDAYDITSGVNAGCIYMGDAIINEAMIHTNINFTDVTIAAANDLGVQGGFILTTGTLVGGSGYVPGTYTGVVFTGGSGTNAVGTVTVNGSGVVSAADSAGSIGSGFVVGDTLTTSNANLGGSGSGFSFKVLSVQGSGFYMGTYQGPAPDAGQSNYGTANWVTYLASLYPTFWTDFTGLYAFLSGGIIDAESAEATSTYQANMINIAGQAVSAGKIPIIPTIPYSTSYDVSPYNAVQPGIFSAVPSALVGPDYYSWMLANPWLLTDGVHMTSIGKAAMRYKTIAYMCTL